MLYQRQQKPQQCAIAGCHSKDLFPAPKSAQQLDDYIWLCRQHIRSYNKNWDYYRAVGPSQYQKDLQAIHYGGVTSWQFSFAANDFGHDAHTYTRASRGHGTAATSDPTDQVQPNQASDKDQQEITFVTKVGKAALAVLNLSSPITRSAIKQSYTRLVKQLHPDFNMHTDKQQRDLREAQLKKVNAAYNTILKLLQH